MRPRAQAPAEDGGAFSTAAASPACATAISTSALADYNAALALEPKMAWSLYGRGLAEHRKGMTAQAKADIAAAIALQKDLPEKAKKIGLVVPN